MCPSSGHYLYSIHLGGEFKCSKKATRLKLFVVSFPVLRSFLLRNYEGRLEGEMIFANNLKSGADQHSVR